MQPIDFAGRNIIFGKEKDGCPIPAHLTKEGIVTSCWKLTLRERFILLFTGKVFITSVTFFQPLQPVLPSTHNPVPAVNNDTVQFIPVEPEQRN